MNGPVVYRPYGHQRFSLLIAAGTIVLTFLAIDLVTTAFTRIGFSWIEAFLVFLGVLLGSAVNLPVFRVGSIVPAVQGEIVSYRGMLFRIPQKIATKRETLIAINVGGALIPLLVSTYLLLRFSSAVPLAAITTLVVLVAVNRLAEPVQDVGVVVLGFWPPLITVVTVLIFSRIFSSPHEARFVAAYAGGTFGTLIGADLMNLRNIARQGGGIASIGGAGTFDGIFLCGVVAVLLT